MSVSCDIQKGISPKGTGAGDNKNDFFDLAGQNVKKLEIFNRYGTKVYSKANYVNEWYGQSDKGDELPDATYFYVIEYNAGGSAKTGWIYINREQ
jgi:gliding motility-associated-like protein